MKCSVTLEREQNTGNRMKTVNGYRNPYRKEPNLDNIVDQLCTRLQDIKEQDTSSRVGMPTCTLEHTEAVRRYYAAFPALTKAEESPLQYYLPPPLWCRKTDSDINDKMQSELSVAKDLNSKNKKLSGKERRNSYHGQRKSSRRRFNSYSRSFESKDHLPEWVTHEGVWDMEAQDPVKEFIRAIALDEGYGTCENTVTDEIKEITQVKLKMNENVVPDWDDSLDLESDWIITEDLNPRVRTPMEEELYAKFEAKFDRSIEALWTKDQNTPDDEYQDLPIDFQDLLSSPSDRLFADPSVEKCSLASLTESIWSTEGPAEPERIVDVLHDRFKPLNLADAPPRPPDASPPLDTFALYDGLDLSDAVAAVAGTMRSFTAINHCKERSGFAEVPPRCRAPAPPAPAAAPAPRAASPREDLLTAARTHFRPIRRDRDRPLHDGDTFDIRGDLDVVEFRRSDSGAVYLAEERYLEYRAADTIDYGRLRLTEAQRCPDFEEPGLRLRFPVRQHDRGVQTERAPDDDDCAASAKKMRPNALASIWSAPWPAAAAAAAPPPDELARDWDELVSDISAAHAEYLRADLALVSAERKRRHSAARAACRHHCAHPHARFLHCAPPPADRPLTR